MQPQWTTRAACCLRPLLCFLILPALHSPAQQTAPSEPRPSFRAERVLPANSDRQNPFGPGLFVSIYGENLGPTTPCTRRPNANLREPERYQFPRSYGFGDAFLYPTELCGVQVLVNDVASGLLYVHERQINFKFPRDIPAGEAQVRVVYRGQSSEAAPVDVGPPFVAISVPEPAYTDMPVWIELYAIGKPLSGSLIGCGAVEVRRGGALLPRIPERQRRGGVNGSECLLMGLPDLPLYNGRLALHMLYRFDEPGTYEVRYFIHPPRPRPLPPSIAPATNPALPRLEMDSAWTSFEVLPAEENQRARWLAETAAAMREGFPSITYHLLKEALPNILGVPDTASLSLLLEYLYHPEPGVRRYAMDNLRYWPEEEANRAIADIVEQRGPTDEASSVLAWKRDLSPQDANSLARSSIPYLQSDSPVLLRGAIVTISALSFRPNSPLSPTVREEALTTAIDDAEHVMQIADSQTAYDYAALLGRIGNRSAHQILWDMIERRVGLGSALSAIMQAGNLDDLPRLGRVLESSSAADPDGRELYTLPSQLRDGYGDAALPYLERALQASPYLAIQVGCARELIRADRQAGLAFALAALQGTDRALSINLARIVRERFPEVHDADDNALIDFLQRRLE